MCVDFNQRHWNPLSYFLNSDEKIALVLLNTPISENGEELRILWNKSSFSAAVDGGLNELHKFNMSRTSGKNPLIPKIITGDFDSVSQKALEHYSNLGSEVIKTPDQSKTDFTKCLEEMIKKISTSKLDVTCIVAYVSFSGRFDHILANVNTLYVAEKLTRLPVYLVNDKSMACLLPPGEHVISVNTGLEGDWCGLIPIGEPCDHVTTTGLKWNLNKQPMAFGGIVSTSNQLDGSPTVTVINDKHLLWTLGINSPTTLKS